MKKIFFATLTMLTLIGYSSCTINNSPDGVTSSEFTVNAGQWVNNGGSGNPNFQYYYGRTMNSITSNIVTNGAVLCYINLGNQWAALPYVETYSSYTRIYGYQYETGTVYVTVKDSDLLTTAPGGSITYKVIILENKSMQLLEGVNTHNYIEVSEALNLEK